ncbi:hypothetical protein COX58_03550 [archaeon CG_4_10_14_0_2_um_filter_Archaea_38_6]|nr:MAG: hypothetical protein COS83_01335 [archaeon CG07_land_8_20_14_0_80_38_8]PIU89582.1 MAG: hypothetical protein COS64_00655 [archaeon CG06_land_8_20_14_3_00_37_11]PJA21683.1 MAG: hypothetical protein COX58_03550 [archaeon CG_4_10_14_0_2_um_filter_Archaea_38_6]
MKVLFFSDAHADKKSIKKVIEKSRNADLLVCAGDLSMMEEGFGEMLEELKKVNKKILIIPGNNETPDFMDEGIDDYENIISIEDEIYQDMNIKFLGIGGSTITPFNTPYELSEGEFRKKLSKYDNTITVLVTHSPAKDTKLDKTSTGLHVGSSAIREWVEENQPKLHCCGHVHENAGKEEMIKNTLSFNPGAEGRIIKI